MGERIAASIRFSGVLPRDQAPRLVKAINDYGLRVDFDGEQATVDNLDQEFGDWEVNYGNLDEITEIATELGLEWEHWFDSGPEWMEATCRWQGGRYQEVTGSKNRGFYFSGHELEKKGMGAVMNTYQEFMAPMPRLVVTS